MNYITLELDTTPPQLDILSPRYTTREIENHITIESNEKLGSFQEIYIIDKSGTRYDLNFSIDNKTLTGIVRFNELAFGASTLFVRVKDEVDNLSQLYQKTIEIKENISRLQMDISHNVRPLFISATSRELILSKSTRELIINIEV